MSLNTQSLQPIINFIWTVEDDILINKYLENQYQDIILPMTVLRRLDLALEPSKDRVLKTYKDFAGSIDNLSGLLSSKEHGSEKEINLTEEYKTTIIASIVTGKIDVRDYEIPDKTEKIEGYELEEEHAMSAEYEVEYLTEASDI